MTRTEVHDKTWGYEIWIANNDQYCGKHLHVAPLKYCSVHYHKNKQETFYVINGTLVLLYSDLLDAKSWEDRKMKRVVLNKGDSFTIAPMIAHRFFSGNNASCDFIEVSSHHDESDTYRIIESSK